MTNRKNNMGINDFEDNDIKSDEILDNDSDINNETLEEIKPESSKLKLKSTKFGTEEITLVADRDIHFLDFSFEKDVAINYSRKAFDQLIKKVPNVEALIKQGAIKIV